MRDYRGKNKSTGKWEYGKLISGQYVIDDRHITAIVTLDTEFFPHCEVAYEEVDPATVGQCTGISAMDEIEGGETRPILIYEGDIVEPVLIGGNCEGFSWGRQVVIFDRGAFCVKDRRGNITPMCNYSEMVRFKLRGNVWDNHEPMEGFTDA